jgi:hypothetical protein
MFELKADGSRNWGMFCYSAQETFDYLLAGCERTWGKTGADSWVTSTCVTISPGDSAVTCHCAECRKTMGPGGSATGASRVMGLFVKRMCEEVKRRWPDKKVIFLPYWNYQACPKDVEFPDNLTVMVCGVGSPMALRCKAGRRRAAEDNLRAWKAAVGGNPITNWDYSDRGSGWTHGPIQYPRLVRDFYQTNRGSLAGTFINGGIASDWTTSAPTLYVWMRVLWNPDVDVDALLDEMCRRLYGPAAGTVRELIEVQCRWETGPWSHNLPDAGRIPPEVFRQVWPAEVVAQMKALRDKALLEVANDPVARQRFLYWTWTFDAFLKDAEEIHDKTP